MYACANGLGPGFEFTLPVNGISLVRVIDVEVKLILGCVFIILSQE